MPECYDYEVMRKCQSLRNMIENMLHQQALLGPAGGPSDLKSTRLASNENGGPDAELRNPYD